MKNLGAIVEQTQFQDFMGRGDSSVREASCCFSKFILHLSNLNASLLYTRKLIKIDASKPEASNNESSTN